MILTVFDSVTSAYTRAGDIHDLSWPDAVTILSGHHDVDSKTDAKLFNLWSFDQNGLPGRRYHYVNGVKQKTYDEIPNTIQRSKANALQCHGIVLDVDNDLTMEAAIERYMDFEFLLYTTFNHTADTHKFRVVLPFTAPLSQEAFELKTEDIVETFKLVDGASFRVSQAFYFHSGKQDQIVHHNKGYIIDPAGFKDTVIPEPVVREPMDFTGEDDDYRLALLVALANCREVHYDDALQIAVLIRSINAGLTEFRQIIEQTMAASSGALRESGKIEEIWNGTTHDRMRHETRDKLLAKLGSVFKYKTSNDKQLARAINEKIKRLGLK